MHIKISINSYTDNLMEIKYDGRIIIHYFNWSYYCEIGPPEYFAMNIQPIRNILTFYHDNNILLISHSIPLFNAIN